MSVEENIITLMDGVDEIGNVRVKTITRITIDGVVVSEKPHRHVIEPGDDLTGQDPTVAALAAIVHTPERIAVRRARDEKIERESQEAIKKAQEEDATRESEAVQLKAAEDDKMANMQKQIEALTKLIRAKA